MASDEDSDSSYVANSQESVDSDSEHDACNHCSHVGHSCKCCTTPKNVNLEEARVAASIRKIKSKKKRSKYVRKLAKKERARNTSYASKLSVLDLQEVEDFLETTRCACEKGCLKILHTMRDEGGVEAVLALRHQRFAST